MRKILMIALPAWILFGCNDDKKVDPRQLIKGKAELNATEQLVSNPVLAWDSVGDLASYQAHIRPELKDKFCVHGYLLPLVADMGALLDVLCTDKKPNANFDKLDRYASKTQGRPEALQLTLTHADDGYSSGVYVAAYRVPVAPKWARNAPIAQAAVQGGNFPNVKFSGRVTKDLSPTLAGGLQFGKWEMTAHMDITSPKGEPFSNDRNTVMDSYQVEGGNPDIGLGAEYLVDTANPKYRRYHQATLTIANHDGSSTMIQIVSVSIKNDGFPETMVQVFNDAANIAAKRIYESILAKKASGYFDAVSK